MTAVTAAVAVKLATTRTIKNGYSKYTAGSCNCFRDLTQYYFVIKIDCGVVVRICLFLIVAIRRTVVKDFFVLQKLVEQMQVIIIMHLY